MPTSYTQPIYDNQPITFEQFALRCAHAMTGLGRYDDPIDAPLTLHEVDETYVTNVTTATTALAEALQRSDAEWTKQQADAIDTAEQRNADYVAGKAELAERYTAMSRQLSKWEPPTGALEMLKRFMRDQLQASASADIHSYEPDVPTPVPTAEYREREIGRLAKEVESASTLLQEQRQRVRTANDSIAALYTSLGVELPATTTKGE